MPAYLVRFRKTGQFDLRRNAQVSDAPDLIAPESGGAASNLQPGRASGPAVGQSATR